MKCQKSIKTKPRVPPIGLIKQRRYESNYLRTFFDLIKYYEIQSAGSYSIPPKKQFGGSLLAAK